MKRKKNLRLEVNQIMTIRVIWKTNFVIDFTEVLQKNQQYKSWKVEMSFGRQKSGDYFYEKNNIN